MTGAVIKYVALLCLLTITPIHATPNCYESDFNGDGLCESYAVDNVDSESYITLNIGGLDKQVSGFFDLGRGALYKGYFPEEMSIALDYYPGNTTLTTYGFRWAPHLKDWTLYRVAYWEEPHRDDKFILEGKKLPAELLIPRAFKVKRFPCCIKFSDFAHKNFDLIPIDDISQKDEIKRDFVRIKKYISIREKNKTFSKYDSGKAPATTLPIELIFELALILDQSNVTTLNNLAYFLVEDGHTASAVILLRAIYRKFPERVVAKLNLADAYQQIGMSSEAFSLYTEYKKVMEASGSSGRIPQRVHDRLSSEKR